MGVITIEVPQRVRRTYRISSEKSGKELISKVEELVRSAENGDSKPIKKKVSLDGLAGIWADRPEPAKGTDSVLKQKRPRNKEKKKEDFTEAMDEAFGMWAYRNESTQEIARKLRDVWNRKDGK